MSEKFSEEELIAKVTDKVYNRIYRNVSIFGVVLQILLALGLFAYIKSLAHEKIGNAVNIQIINEIQKSINDVEAKIIKLKEKAGKADSDLVQMTSDLQKWDEAVSRQVFGEEGSTDIVKSKLPIGWTFFAEKYKRSKKFSKQGFRVVNRTLTSPKNRSKSYPYKGDTVECIRLSQYVRTGPPAKSKLRPVVGTYKKGDKGVVLDVLEIKDKYGNIEVWISVEQFK